MHGGVTVSISSSCLTAQSDCSPLVVLAASPHSAVQRPAVSTPTSDTPVKGRGVPPVGLLLVVHGPRRPLHVADHMATAAATGWSDGVRWNAYGDFDRCGRQLR
jgi:hypothetical protein